MDSEKTKEQKEVLEKVSSCVVNGKLDECTIATRKALEMGVKPYDILMEGCKHGMDIVGDLYQNQKIYLPQVLSSARVMYGAIDILKPLMVTGKATESRGKIVIGVAEGDVHDIGKNIVRILLDGMAYTVFALGRDVPLNNFIETVEKEGVDIVACSTLMTTTLASIEDLINALKEHGLDKKVNTIIGGAATNQVFADDVGADAWGKDASDGVSKVNDFMAKRRK